MSKIKIKLLTFIVLVLTAQAGRTEIDTSLFQWKKRDTVDQKIKFNFGESDSNPQAEVLDESLSLEVIDVRIKSFSSIIRNEKDDAKNVDILISRASLYLQKANILRKQKSAGDKVSKAELKAFQAGQADLLKVITLKSVEPEKLSYAHYLMALIEVDLGNVDNAFKNFQTALRLDPKSRYTPGIVFFMSEHHYKMGDSQKSFQLLDKYLPTMKGDDYAMALYKMAWSLVGSGQKFNAEKYFIRLIKESSTSIAAKAAIRELALVSSEIKSEREIVEMADTLFAKDPAKRLEFLSTTYSNYRRENPEFKAKIIFDRLIKFANTPEKRVDLWLNEMRASDRPFASLAQMSAFNSLDRELKQLSDDKRMELVGKLSSEIEVEVTRLLSSYLKTYTGDEKNEESLSKTQLGDSLTRQLAFYTKNFPKSDKIAQVYELWMDVAESTDNHPELLKLSNQVIANPKFTAIHEKAELLRIRALDKLSDGKNANLKKDLTTALNKYLADREKPKWREFANYQVDLLFEMNDKEAAIDWLRVIHNRYQDKKSFDRLVTGCFDSKQYQLVINLSKETQFMDKRVMDIIQESNLQLAIESKDSNKDAYQTHIKSYLTLSKDQNKKVIVLSDYFNQLIKDKKWSALYKEMKALEVDWIHFEGQIDQLTSHLYLNEKWKHVAELLEKLPKLDRSQNLFYRKVVTNYSLSKVVVPGDFLKLKKDSQAYFLQNLAIANPNYALSLLESPIGKQPGLKEMGLLAVQTKCQNFLPDSYCALSRPLEKEIAKGLHQSDKSPVEKILDKTKFSSLSQNLDQNLLNVADQIRSARSKVADSLKNSDYHVKLRTLASMQKAELEVSSALARIKPPESLSAPQRRKFVDEVEELSNEFKNQASTFAKISQEMTDAYIGKSSTRSLASTAGMPWPEKGQWIEELRSIAIKHDKMTALLYIDSMKRTGMKNVTFHQLRALVMQEALPNPVIKRFFIEELSEPELKKLEEQWKNL